MEPPAPEDAVRDAIRHWSSLTTLAEFAVQRHGYGNTDGGFGVTYPGDLDEYDCMVGDANIPDGLVEVYGFWDPPEGYVVLITESFYLDTLAEVLSAAGHEAEAKRLRSLVA